MNVLAFDCSTRACSAAVLAEDEVLARRGSIMERGHAEALIPTIEGVLADAALDWPSIGLIGVTVGPGTFTGLRIGLAAARGLALASGLPVAGVSTTEALAWAVPPTERTGRTLLVLVDGKRADLFAQAFGPDLDPLGEAGSLLPEDLPGRFPGPLALAGDGAARAGLPDAVLTSALAVDAVVVARLALVRHRSGTALPLSPLYLAPADVTLPGCVR